MASAGQIFSAMPSRIRRQLQRSAAGSSPAAPPVLHRRGGFAGDSKASPTWGLSHVREGFAQFSRHGLGFHFSRISLGEFHHLWISFRSELLVDLYLVCTDLCISTHGITAR